MNTRWWDLLAGVLFGLLSAGLIILVCKPRPGQAVLLRPPPTPVPVVVNVDGAVQLPGVYSLPVHSRVMDAVEAAGGLKENASSGSINLAAELEDGSHIFVPYLQDTDSPDPSTGADVMGISQEGKVIPLVNINQASRDQLISLPGIGPVTADKIIAYRQEKLFTRIEEIQKVPGIGPATFELIEPYLTVGE
jgi:competence protein ComEA